MPVTQSLDGRLAILTSGGDAPGMNPALRSAVRSALDQGIEVVAITEGFSGLVAGGDHFRSMDWESVGGILHLGGTAIGSARSPEFRKPEGRRTAVRNLIENDITRLIVIGGDGSLTAADLLHREWPDHVKDLVAAGDLTPEAAEKRPGIVLAGLAGSIDNDFHGTDMTIGADTALHRITQAIDALTSTAASHQRTFVVEVMGRNCGYLALMSALATGADAVFIPEKPPEDDDWARRLCDRLRAGRKAGRRDSIIIVAEGAHDRHGRAITSSDVREILERGMAEEVRLTILGHVQRGGAPSAFDRTMSTLLGHAAVEYVLAEDAGAEPQLIGVRNNRIQLQPLAQCVEQTGTAAQAIADGRHDEALRIRGGSFSDNLDTLHTLLRSLAESTPARPATAQDRRGPLGCSVSRDEHRRPGRGPPRPRCRPRHAGCSQRFRRFHRGSDRRARLDECARLVIERRLRTRDQPQGTLGSRLLHHRPDHRGPGDRRHSHRRRLVGLPHRLPFS